MLLCGVQEKFFSEHSTLLVADSEIIVDIFKYCVNINANLLKQRDIEIVATDATTNCENTDVVMQEMLPPRVLDQLARECIPCGSYSLTCESSNEQPETNFTKIQLTKKLQGWALKL